MIYAQARRNEAAIEDYSRAETLTQDNDLRATINGDRANVYFGAGDFDEASKNLQAALRFDPKNVYALSLLGNIDLARGDYGQAKADLNHALKFESDNDQLLWVRGEAEMYGGDVLAAVKDMQKSVSLSHDDGHKILWMHIVRVHAKQADGQEFDRNSEQADADLWPNSLLRLYRGTGTAEQVVAQAKIGDLLLQSDQLCEAHFYIGEWEYEHGNMGAARSLFQEASDDCPKDFIEYSGARAELRAMNFKQ